MQIFTKTKEEYEEACRLKVMADYNMDIIILPPDHSYAICAWSVKDVDEGNITNEKVLDMTDDEKRDFLEYASSQLHSDMVDRGFDSLNDSFELYLTATGDSDEKEG